MNQSEIYRIFKDFNSKTILVIGDVMIDAYLVGKVHRISPEAPVPIVSVTERENRLGGAANVALNIAALGAKAIMASVISDDDKANDFENILSKSNLSTSGILRSKNRVTTKKTRIISNYQQLLRVDEEETSDLNQEDSESFINHLNNLFVEEKIDAIILQDYNKGVITKPIIEFVVNKAKQLNIPVTADPKKKNFDAFDEVTLFKPNLKELTEGLNIDTKPNLESLTKAFHVLVDNMNIKKALITLSEKGVFIANQNDQNIYPAHVRNIADVSGAGDTVIAVASLCLTTNCNDETMAKLSNLAGGLVCEKVGVVPIDKERLMEEAISFEK